MVDFGKIVGKPKDVGTFDLEKLFGSLDVKATHTELRQAQREACKALSDIYTGKDIVLKVSTGSGKTTIGLLFSYAHMRISGAPAAFLCPTVQLVNQVLEEADRLGIRAIHYPAGEPYPDPSCMRGEAVLVCTYEKMFNAKSTFARHDVNLCPFSIVLDDAHAGVEIIRKAFTLGLTGEPYERLKSLLEPTCSKYHQRLWMDIKEGDPFALLEVPFWLWADLQKEILSLLHPYASSQQFIFVWPYLADMLTRCRCVISGDKAEIAPEVLPTHLVRAYSQPKHRLFMSATLADDSILVRELGVSASAAEKPVLPDSDRGLGERMIITPSLVDPNLERGYAMGLCADLAKQFNVVVLTSSELLAKDWMQYGAKVFLGDTFAKGVQALKEPQSGVRFAVFPQRYDGVDLPDDACRVLVIDGMPHGEGLIDKLDARSISSPGGTRNRVIYRIEQGMGRAVRSHADYAVVILIGQDLATFVGRVDVLVEMTRDTRNQLGLSIELADLVKQSKSGDPDQAIRQVIGQCLGRDQGWKDFYNERIRNVEKLPTIVDSKRIQLAADERRAYELAELNNPTEAKTLLQNSIGANLPDGEEVGVYLQRLARIVYSYDPVESMKIQGGAYQRNRAMSIPPTVIRKPPNPGTKPVAEMVRDWVLAFSNLNGAVIEVKRITAEINLANKHERVEAALKRLGEALGAESSRPDDELGIGPDNLWLWGNITLVIEAKNENQKTLHKSDASQAMQNSAWVKKSFPAQIERIKNLVVARVTKLDHGVIFPDKTKVLTQAGIDKLMVQVENFFVKIAAQGPVFITADHILAEMGNYGLLPEQFFGNYTEPLS